MTKNSYQPSIKIIVSCGALKTASSGMVRSVHGTHPLKGGQTKGYLTFNEISPSRYKFDQCSMLVVNDVNI